MFDIEPADGVIKDPVSLATTGPLPNNGNSGSSNDDGGSSSGCTVGSTPSYDLLVMFLGMSYSRFLARISLTFFFTFPEKYATI